MNISFFLFLFFFIWTRQKNIRAIIYRKNPGKAIFANYSFPEVPKEEGILNKNMFLQTEYLNRNFNPVSPTGLKFLVNYLVCRYYLLKFIRYYLHVRFLDAVTL